MTYPSSRVIAFRGASGWGETPVERLAWCWTFPKKNRVSRENVGREPFVLFRYDDCRHPRRGAPAADWWLRIKIKKTSLPLRASERPWGGCPSYSDDFYVSGANITDSYGFLKNRSFQFNAKMIHFVYSGMRAAAPERAPPRRIDD